VASSAISSALTRGASRRLTINHSRSHGQTMYLVLRRQPARANQRSESHATAANGIASALVSPRWH
jgi:hypothetical protein